VKEKVLAARRAGVTTVILPQRNEKDLEDVPAAVREEMRFRFVETIDEVLDLALEPPAIPVDTAVPSFREAAPPS
jgi:ATP-dependent Lon protease